MHMQCQDRQKNGALLGMPLTRAAGAVCVMPQPYCSARDRLLFTAVCLQPCAQCGSVFNRQTAARMLESLSASADKEQNFT